jgi:Fe-S cluster biogenesis protein NfuA
MPAGIADGSLKTAAEERLRASVSPLLHAHGGDVRIQSVSQDGVITLEFCGACVGCPLRPVTLAVLIEPRLKTLDGVTRVDGGVRISVAAARRLTEVHARSFAPGGSDVATSGGGSSRETA